MIYAFIDTNIFVRIATQGRPGCEQTHFDDLRTLATEGLFRLLVPEVVLLELDKCFHRLPRDIESNCDKLCDAVNKATKDTWSEIDSLKVEVLNRIKDFKKTKATASKEISSDVLAFLNSEPVVTIPLSTQILLAAKRRQIAERMPNFRRSSDQDVLIVESLASYFSDCDDEEASLMFVSENTNDFALEIVADSLERRFALDPSIQDGLPQARFSTDLASMLRVVQGFEELPAPTTDEIKYAANMRDLHDVDEDEHWTFQQILTEAVHRESAKQFREEFLPSVPDDVQVLRNQLSTQVMSILAQCRRCPAWSERSEYKLPQWIEYVDEQMIPYTSLPKLVRIKNSLERYLDVLTRLDEEDSAGSTKNEK